MSLITPVMMDTRANLAISEALTTTYSRSVVRGSWTWTAANVSGAFDKMQEVHRYARESFRFVGYTEEAAKLKRDELVSLYTRSFRYSDWDSTVSTGAWDVCYGGSRVMADIALVHDEGDSWSVNVTVNEDDVRMVKVGVAINYDSLFASEIARTYVTTEV